MTLETQYSAHNCLIFISFFMYILTIWNFSEFVNFCFFRLSVEMIWELLIKLFQLFIARSSWSLMGASFGSIWKLSRVWASASSEMLCHRSPNSSLCSFMMMSVFDSFFTQISNSLRIDAVHNQVGSESPFPLLMLYPGLTLIRLWWLLWIWSLRSSK